MTMTLRERLESTIRGGTADRIPWNIYAWLLPQTEAGRRMHERGLGLLGNARLWREVHEGVTVREEHGLKDGLPLTRTTIETPVGTIWQEVVRESHHNSLWIRKFFITGPEDYGPAEYYFRHTRMEPEYEAWPRADAEIGVGGVTCGEIWPLPILLLSQSWMGVEGLAEGLYLYRDRFDALIDVLDGHYLRHAELAAESPAELIWFPESLTATIISPALFHRYCLPLYERAVPVVRGAGKLITAHYDGSIRPLLDLLAGVDIPVIEAFNPPPMGDVTVPEAKAAWPHKTVWINFPGCYFLEPPEAIYSYTLDLLRTGAPGGRLVIGCTEDFPVDQFEKTYDAIGRALADYEGYPW